LLKNPNEPEFLQAVLEVAETVIPLSKKIKNINKMLLKEC
jgi:glutamate dehydrogenase (NADP+)